METKLKLVYVDNDHSREWLMQKAWAEGILAKPNVLFPSGRYSHDCARDVLDEALLELVEDLAIQVSQ